MQPPSNVVTLVAGGLVSRAQQTALETLDESIADALRTAKAAGVPRGLIVSLVQAHSFLETQKMVTST